MKDESLNRLAYIINQKPWVDNADVTLKDVITTGIIPIQCEMVNNILHKMTGRFQTTEKWEPEARKVEDFILNMIANYDNKGDL